MPDLEKRLSFPFTIRDMLSFEHGVAFALKIVSQSTSTSPLTIRGMTADGLFAFTHTPRSDLIAKTERFRITDIPIWVTVVDKDGTAVQGDTYVTLSIEINDDILYELCAGLVYKQKSISWPQNNALDIRPGGGLIVDITSSDPAAGIGVTYTIPAGYVLKLISAYTTLVTDATVTNRRAHFTITYSAGGGFASVSLIDQPASTTRNYTISGVQSDNTVLTGTRIGIPIPENLLLRTNDVITMETINFQAGDNWTAIILRAELFFNPI